METQEIPKLKVFVMSVVTETLTIWANDEMEAEDKYDAHFNGDACPCGNKDCECVLVGDECYHITTGEDEAIYTQKQVNNLLVALKELGLELQVIKEELS